MSAAMIKLCVKWCGICLLFIRVISPIHRVGQHILMVAFLVDQENVGKAKGEGQGQAETNHSHFSS